MAQRSGGPQEVESRQEPALVKALEMVAPGTALREGLDDIVHARTGGLITIGDPDELLFLFSGGGAINQLLGYVGIHGPNWTADSRGVFHQAVRVVGVDSAPGWARHEFFNLSWWDWLSGPSVAMVVIITLVVWTTSGTFMLMFLAGLQNMDREQVDAALVARVAAEGLGDERLDERDGVVDRVLPRADRDDVGVVVLPAQLRGLGAPHAGRVDGELALDAALFGTYGGDPAARALDRLHAAVLHDAHAGGAGAGREGGSHRRPRT